MLKDMLKELRLKRKRKKAVPVVVEDDFLTTIRCAVHDWEPVVERELKRAKDEALARKKLRRRKLRFGRT